MAGYAFALYHCMHSAFAAESSSAPVGLVVRPLGWRVNLGLHCACWGVPVLMVVSVYLQDDARFGGGEDEPLCSLSATQAVRVAFTALL